MQQTLNEFSNLCANTDFSMYLCSPCLHLASSWDSCSVGFSWVLFSELFQLGIAISADKPEINAMFNCLIQFLLRANGRPVLALQSGGFEARLCIQLWNKLLLGDGRTAAQTHCQENQAHGKSV